MSKTFAIEYPWRDGTYILNVQAESADDAIERVRQAANHGRCNTPHGVEPLAINAAWYANIVVGFRNWIGR